MSRESEIRYRLQVEPPVMTIMNKIRSDVGSFGVSDDEFIRAVWSWVDDIINEYETVPQWIWQELAHRQTANEAANTIEGEVEGE